MKKVAALDDDESLLELYQTVLEDEGYGMEAVVFNRQLDLLLENIRATQADMLILDIHLPGLGSFEIMQAMKADPELAALPILVCSASRPSLNVLRELMVGVNLQMPTVLEKPFDLDELLRSIEDLIGKSA